MANMKTRRKLSCIVLSEIRNDSLEAEISAEYKAQDAKSWNSTISNREPPTRWTWKSMKNQAYVDEQGFDQS